jgi:hypothetical protein
MTFCEKKRSFFGVVQMLKEMFTENALDGVIGERKFLSTVVEAVDLWGGESIHIDPSRSSLTTRT